MTEQTQPLNLRAKLSAVYARVDHIEKAGRNQKQNYDYVRSADVLHAIRKALVEFRVYAETNFDLLSTYNIATNSGGNMHTATVKAFIVFHDLDSDEKITASGLGDGADGGDKGIYKAQTGAIKNALRNAFLVPDAADPEADQSVDDAVSEPVRQSKPVQPPKAEIPAASVAIPKDVTFTQTTVVTGVPKSGGPLPTTEQLDAYRVRLRSLTTKLQGLPENQKLKHSVSLPAPRKVLNYILKVTETKDNNLLEITVAQWEAFLSFAEKAEPVELVKLINGGTK